MFLKQIRSNVYKIVKMIVRLQLMMQNYLMKHLEIFCKRKASQSVSKKNVKKSDLQISQKQKRKAASS